MIYIKKQNCLLVMFMISFVMIPAYLSAQKKESFTVGNITYKVPRAYLEQPKEIPDFWISEIDPVTEFLYTVVKKGKIEVIGKSVSGRPIRAVTYGTPRGEKGTSTFSGSLGFRDFSAYRGADNKKVYMSTAAVHGGEFEGIVGMVNLIAIIETGRDLRGKEWPEVNEVVKKIDRIVLVPITNPDARARIPVRMLRHWGTDKTALEYLNTGGHADGSITGWPQVKEYIPVDLSRPGFPGGYPNDNGVNLRHDDFFGSPQPETRILYDLTSRERPDLIIDMHTGAIYPNIHAPFNLPFLYPAFEGLFTQVQGRFNSEGLAVQKDAKEKIKVPPFKTKDFSLEAALNMNCGALSVVFESPSHAFGKMNSKKEIVALTPDQLLDGQIFLHTEAMRFLGESEGLSQWLQ